MAPDERTIIPMLKCDAKQTGSSGIGRAARDQRELAQKNPETYLIGSDKVVPGRCLSLFRRRSIH